MSPNEPSESATGLVLSVLHAEFDLDIPRSLARDFVTQLESLDISHPTDLTSAELADLFLSTYARDTSPLRYLSSRVTSASANSSVVVRLRFDERHVVIDASGTGPLDAFVQGLSSSLGIEMQLRHFSSHALASGNTAAAVAYVCALHRDILGLPYEVWGVGTDRSILDASFKAVVASVNRSHWRPVTVLF